MKQTSPMEKINLSGGQHVRLKSSKEIVEYLSRSARGAMVEVETSKGRLAVPVTEIEILSTIEELTFLRDQLGWQKKM